MTPLLSAWDELLVHQTALPVAEAGTSDHRFFDRIVVLGHDPDDRYAVLLGLAVYKNVNVMEGFACVRSATTQHNLRLSRSLRPTGPTLEIGPLRVDVEVPMRRLRATLDAGPDWPHAFDLTFDSPLVVEAEEPHLHAVDGRRSEDFLRFHQLGSLAGTVRIGTDEVAAQSWFGLRDHSWGVRPGVGGFEPRSRERSVGWTSSLFGWFAFVTPESTGQFELRADADGTVRHLVGHVVDRTSGVRAGAVSVEHDAVLVEGTGRFSELCLRITDSTGRAWSVTASPAGRSWVFRGTGYDRGYLDGRGLGWWRGDDVVEVDEYDVSHVEDVVMSDGESPVRTRHREQPVHVVVDGVRGEGHTFWSVGA